MKRVNKIFMEYKMTSLEIFAEMARRKVRFYSEAKWDQIKLWGLFKWSDVSHMLKNGQLITNYKKENKTIWVIPSKETWENNIQPLIKNNSLKELTLMAGWDI